MSGKSFVLLLCMVMHQCSVYAQQDIYVFIDSTTIIGKITDNRVYTGPNAIAYTISGNILYAGDSTTRSAMLFGVNAKNILSKKSGLVFQADMQTVQYFTMHSSFYLGDHPIDRDNERLLSFEVINDSLCLVRSGQHGDSLIGTVEGRFTNQVQIVAAAHLYIRHYHLDELVRKRMLQLEGEIVADGTGIIRPMYDRGPYYEWTWDGKTLKPYWGYRPEDEWNFDGKYLKPAWTADPQSEWVWDGTILKPFWDAGVEHQWIWRDGMLKPFWDSDPDRQWVMEDNVIRPMWRFNTMQEWVVEGQVPLPVVALVVLGYADR